MKVNSEIIVLFDTIVQESFLSFVLSNIIFLNYLRKVKNIYNFNEGNTFIVIIIHFYIVCISISVTNFPVKIMRICILSAKLYFI